MLGDKPMPSGKHRNGKIWKKTLIKGVFVIFVSHVSLFCSLWQYVTMLFAELPSKSSNRSPKTTRSALHLQHTLLSEPSLEGACRGLATTAFQAFHGYSMAPICTAIGSWSYPSPIPTTPKGNSANPHSYTLCHIACQAKEFANIQSL